MITAHGLTHNTDQGELEMPDTRTAGNERRQLPGYGPPPEAIRLPLDAIEPNPSNPRSELVDIEAFASNIHEYGLMQPITVRRISGDEEDERYQLIAGHRRHAAFAQLRERYPFDVQWRTIPAVIRRADEARAYLMLLSSQLHTASFSPQEEASAIDRLLAEGLDQLGIAKALHRSEGWVSKRRRVYEDAVLSGPVQTGQLSPGVAEELVPVQSAERRQELAERAIEEAWSQKEARSAARTQGIGKTLMVAMRHVRELRPLLRDLHPEDLRPQHIRELDELRMEIVSLAQRPKRGEKRAAIIPSMERAREVAGISERANSNGHDRNGHRTPGLKVRQG